MHMPQKPKLQQSACHLRRAYQGTYSQGSGPSSLPHGRRVGLGKKFSNLPESRWM